MVKLVKAELVKSPDGWFWFAEKYHGDRKPIISRCGPFKKGADCKTNCEREYLNFNVEWKDEMPEMLNNSNIDKPKNKKAV